MNLAFVAPSAVRLKDAEYRSRRGANVIALHIERGNQRGQTEILPACGNGADDVVRQRFLSLCTLGIDHRSFAGHRDALRNSADSQLCIDICNEASGKLDALPDNACESRKRERHAVS